MYFDQFVYDAFIDDELYALESYNPVLEGIVGTIKSTVSSIVSAAKAMFKKIADYIKQIMAKIKKAVRTLQAKMISSKFTKVLKKLGKTPNYALAISNDSDKEFLSRLYPDHETSTWTVRDVFDASVALKVDFDEAIQNLQNEQDPNLVNQKMEAVKAKFSDVKSLTKLCENIAKLKDPTGQIEEDGSLLVHIQKVEKRRDQLWNRFDGYRESAFRAKFTNTDAGIKFGKDDIFDPNLFDRSSRVISLEKKIQEVETHISDILIDEYAEFGRNIEDLTFRSGSYAIKRPRVSAYRIDDEDDDDEVFEIDRDEIWAALRHFDSLLDIAERYIDEELVELYDEVEQLTGISSD